MYVLSIVQQRNVGNVWYDIMYLCIAINLYCTYYIDVPNDGCANCYVQDEISLSLKTHLQEVMNSYGITILNALVTDLTPDYKVRDAMNEINASKRLKEVRQIRVYVCGGKRSKS